MKSDDDKGKRKKKYEEKFPKDSDGNFILPMDTLARLNEFSGGGYLLFILDEKGIPTVYGELDTEPHESLIKNYAMDWLKADKQIRLEEMGMDISNERGFSFIEEEDDDDDD